MHELPAIPQITFCPLTVRKIYVNLDLPSLDIGKMEISYTE